MNIWKRKLLAYLHDPPHKALDIPGHEENRAVFVRQAGFVLPDAAEWFDRPADWWASAADRYPTFTSDLRSPFGGADHPFNHPLGGSSLALPEFPSPEVLGGFLQDVQPHGEGVLDAFTGDERDRVNFFLHWRRWAVEAAQKEWRSAYQPAETRLPDHPIWLHNSVTSALQGCEGNPAFLIFQIGPVQEFIAQARSTRDLWSGSYMLSWLMAHGIKAVTDRVGPDAVIFPFLRAQPLFDLLHRDAIYERVKFKGDTLWSRLKLHEREMLVPNLPNKFLAVVPNDMSRDLAEAAQCAAKQELVRIADAAWKWISNLHKLEDSWRERFDLQIAAFLQVTWHIYRWDLNETSWPDVKELYGCEGKDMPFTPNAGQFWAHHYEEADRLHAARRNTRDFDPWMRDVSLMKASKDTLSGKEEIVGDAEAWWDKMPKGGNLSRLFRSSDKMGAINIVKKVWHLAYLQDVWNLDPRRAVSFNSVPDIAAAEWLSGWRHKRDELAKESVHALDQLLKTCRLIHNNADQWSITVPDMEPTDRTLDAWLDEVAPEAFLESEWKKDGEECASVRAALRSLYEQAVGKPPGYVAVIAFDGDEIGKWISGEKTPLLRDQFSKEARERLAGVVGDRRRPLSPSYHLQFSEALANFAIYLVRPVVEHFSGQVIYAGGDDVLAMVPAARALDCAEALRDAFRGQRGLPGVYEIQGSKGGFAKLAQPKGEQPTWPLIVPGPRAEASVGIAIGHMHSPLQAMVREAQAAEKRAKHKVEDGGFGREAFAVTVFKRSGEVLQWGAKWTSGALELYREFLGRTLNGDVSGKFAYALDELIGPYRNTGGMKDPPGFDAKAIITLELERVLDRQIDKRDKRTVAGALRPLAMTYLNSLAPDRATAEFPLLFRTAAFINRGERE